MIDDKLIEGKVSELFTLPARAALDLFQVVSDNNVPAVRAKDEIIRDNNCIRVWFKPEDVAEVDIACRLISMVARSDLAINSKEDIIQCLTKRIELDALEESDRHARAVMLKMMDDAVSHITDEEEPAIGRWKAFGIPDESSVEYIEELLDDEDLYDECCRIFAEEISRVIVKGEWTKDGWTAEFYSSKHDQTLKRPENLGSDELQPGMKPRDFFSTYVQSNPVFEAMPHEFWRYVEEHAQEVYEYALTLRGTEWEVTEAAVRHVLRGANMDGDNW